MEKAISDIKAELEYARAKWGDDFDRKNTPNDWVAYIAHYLGRTVTLPWNRETFRASMVKAAGLCISAIEWCDRTDGNMPKRHYD